MIKTSEARGAFFAVKFSVVIQGARYVPAVCYPLGSGLQAVVEEMSAKGLARIFTERVRFVTGVPYPVSEPKQPAATAAALPAPVVRVAPASAPGPAPAGRSARKSGRNAFTNKAGREFA